MCGTKLRDLTIVFLVWTAFSLSGVVGDRYKQEDAFVKLMRLREDILKRYDKNVRPMNEHTAVTLVKVGLKPLYIIELNEENQFMKMDAELIMVWNDVRLAWTKSDFANKLHFGDHEVWQPDITVYNGHEMNVDPKGNTHVLVVPNGDVIWVPPASLTTRCKVDLKDYPNDRQTCDVIVGSWAHDGSAIVLQPYQDSVALEDFDNSNPRWELVDSRVRTVNRFYNCCNEAFVTTVFSFTLQRRPPAALQEVWGPTAACLALTLVMFWLPPHSGKKILLGGFVLVSLISLLVYVAITNTSTVSPWTAVSPLHSAVYVVVSAIVLEVVLVINMSTVCKSSTPPQLVIRFLTGTCGKFLCICRSRPQPIDVCLMERSEQNLDSSERTIREEWYLVASALDRLLFVIFALIVAAIYKWP